MCPHLYTIHVRHTEAPQLQVCVHHWPDTKGPSGGKIMPIAKPIRMRFKVVRRPHALTTICYATITPEYICAPTHTPTGHTTMINAPLQVLMHVPKNGISILRMCFAIRCCVYPQRSESHREAGIQLPASAMWIRGRLQYTALSHINIRTCTCTCMRSTCQ